MCRLPRHSGAFIWKRSRIAFRPRHHLVEDLCTVAEVSDYTGGNCASLSTNFSTNDARRTSDGGYIVCGRVTRTNEYSSCGGACYTDAFLLKTDSRGNPIWYKRYQPQGGGAFWYCSVIEDAASGNIIVGGQTPGADAFVMGTNSTGTVHWNHKITAVHATQQAFGLPSRFTKVASYMSRKQQRYYVLTGPAIVQVYGTNYNACYGGGMLTAVNAGGALAQNVQLTQDQNMNHMKTSPVADAHDGNVVMTGSSGGTYCGPHDEWNMMLMKLDPLTLAPRFMKVYQSASNEKRKLSDP